MLCCCVSFCSLLDGVCLSGNKRITYLLTSSGPLGEPSFEQGAEGSAIWVLYGAATESEQTLIVAPLSQCYKRRWRECSRGRTATSPTLAGTNRVEVCIMSFILFATGSWMSMSFAVDAGSYTQSRHHQSRGKPERGPPNMPLRPTHNVRLNELPTSISSPLPFLPPFSTLKA